jgi:hypothetical protein
MGPTHSLRPSRSRSVGQPVQPAAYIAAPATDDGRPRDPDALGDLGIRGAVGGQQQDLGPLRQHGGQLAGPSPSA